MRTLLLSTQRDVHSIELKITSLRMLLSLAWCIFIATCSQVLIWLNVYILILIFKLNFKYLGPQDLRQWFNSAFTFIICFTLLGSVCFGAVPSKKLYDPSPGYHFNKRCLYHLSSNSCAILGLVQPFMFSTTFMSWFHQKVLQWIKGLYIFP